MKKLIALFVFVLIAFVGNSQVINSLTITGYVTNANNGFALNDYPVNITGDDGQITFFTTTNENGWYIIVIENGSVIGPNQEYVVFVEDSCSNAILSDTISNNQGTIDEAVVNFEVCGDSLGGCQAFFNWTISNNNPLRIILMDDSYVADGATYFWNFGDGETATTVNAEHTFSESGSYEVCLTVTKDNCTDTYCTLVVVVAEPFDCNANFEAEFVPGGLGVGVYPSFPMIGEANYTWSVDGVTISNDFDIPVISLTPGNHLVCFSVTTSSCEDSFCQEIVISNDTLPQGCQAYFNWEISNSNPLRLIFSDDSYIESEASYFWDFGDNNIASTMNAEHTFTEAGIYTVCLTVTTSGCTDTYCISVEVGETGNNSDCNASFDYSIDNVTEEGIFSVTFHSVDVPPATQIEHEWVIDGYDNQYSSNPQFQLNQAGNYLVCHYVYSSNCADTVCTYVYVAQDTASCEAYFAASLSQFNPFRVICENQSFTNNEEASYLWDFGDGTTATSLNAEHNYQQAGPYLICLTVVTPSCESTYCETFYVPPTNPQNYTIGGQVFAGANYADIGSAKLFYFDQTSSAVELVQTVAIDSFGYYVFSDVSEGVYLIKAGLNNQSAYFGQYVPTYFGSQFYWFDAEPVVVNESGFSYNISLIYSDNPGGEGWVEGNIDDGPYRLSGIAGSAASLVSDADIFVLNLSGNPQKHQLSTENGEFAFSNLAYGTYRLMADVPGMICIPVEFTLSGGTPGVTIELVMGDEITAIAQQQDLSFGNPFPNPANDFVGVSFHLKSSQKIISSLTTTSGQLVWEDSGNYFSGTQTMRVPLNQVAKGFYFLSLRDAQNKQLGVFKISVIH
jgi:PKD repeat protein